MNGMLRPGRKVEVTGPGRPVRLSIVNGAPTALAAMVTAGGWTAGTTHVLTHGPGAGAAESMHSRDAISAGKCGEEVHLQVTCNWLPIPVNELRGGDRADGIRRVCPASVGNRSSHEPVSL